MNRKGFVWVSAVLYIALGIVAISLVLSAGLPLINKMRDRNTILQTKDVMNAIDKNIWQVRSEGVGSRRFLEPVIIKGGKLMIYGDTSSTNQNKIIWEMKTQAKIMEACPYNEATESWCKQSEGNLLMIGQETKIKDEYLITLELDYNGNMKIVLGEGYTAGSALVGKYGISIENIAEGNIKLTIK